MANIQKKKRQNKPDIKRKWLHTPRILIPCIICLVILSFFLTWCIANGKSSTVRPVTTKTYNEFVLDLNKGQISEVRMYKDEMHIQLKDKTLYYTQDVSPDYTINLILKKQVTLKGIDQPQPYPVILCFGVLIAILIPYGILAWLVFMVVNSISGAANPKVDLDKQEQT